jgi:hypothetical protein
LLIERATVMQEEGRAEECHGETKAEEATENVVVEHSRKTKLEVGRAQWKRPKLSFCIPIGNNLPLPFFTDTATVVPPLSLS